MTAQGGIWTQFREARILTRFARACACARSRGRSEPTLAESRERGLLDELVFGLRTRSLYSFRRAGAAWLEQRYLVASWRLVLAVLAWPPAGLGKLKEQFGRRVPRRSELAETGTPR